MNDKLEPLPVKGYTSQDPAKVREVNVNKQMEELLIRRVESQIKRFGRCPETSTALRYFKEGFMSLNRAVFQPQRLADKEIDTDMLLAFNDLESDLE